MANVLFLVHRIPWPPNKGDKLRSYHLLRGLAARHRVFLGTLVDDPDDWEHLPALRDICADVCAVPLHPMRARMASLAALTGSEPLTLRYFRSARLHRWVRRTVRGGAVDAVVVFSSSMAPYAEPHPDLPLVVDFVDVDSAKWADYAARHRWPWSWVYAREARTLADAERRIAQRAAWSTLVSAREAALFRQRVGAAAGARVEVVDNGVDAGHYTPDPARPSPFADRERALVFTGTMSHWPNADAVCWFARSVWPGLREVHPDLRLHIVGRAPLPQVRALASDAASGIVVTGTVPDVRPWLQHAAVVVAPLRVARGVQNKVLEGMAMARPVVASGTCAAALDVEPGRDLLSADAPEDYIGAIGRLLHDSVLAEAMGQAGRRRVLQRYAWAPQLERFERCLARAMAPARAATGSMPLGRPA